MKYIRKESVSFLKAVKTQKGTARVLFTTRHGGFSKGKYKSLNLSFYVGDDEGLVKENRKIVAGFLSKKSDFVSVEQIHGKGIYRINGSESGHLKDVHADAIISEFTDVAIGVLTADCVPLILVGESGKIAAVHAGWKGLYSGIICETLKEFSVGEDIKKIKAFAGPAIGVCCYQVGKEVAEVFEEAYPESIIEKGESIFLDLKEIAKVQLIESGLQRENIYISPDCTSCLSNIYFSYRREGGITGRQAGLAVITVDDL